MDCDKVAMAWLLLFCLAMKVFLIIRKRWQRRKLNLNDPDARQAYLNECVANMSATPVSEAELNEIRLRADVDSYELMKAQARAAAKLRHERY
jgi:hypothetical protein